MNITKKDKIFTIENVSFIMKPVIGGTFMMGTVDNNACIDEKPAHQVTLNDYYIGETQVTQELWRAVMGDNPSTTKNDDLPVESVNWDDCQKFIHKLNSITGLKFRLPTEAEWEFAARGGNNSKGFKYSGGNNLGIVAWYFCNSNNKPHPVKRKFPNELSIYDMSGNIWEWCSDWYDSYSNRKRRNPTGPRKGSVRVLRGGSYYCSTRSCRVSFRSCSLPISRFYSAGLRLAL